MSNPQPKLGVVLIVEDKSLYWGTLKRQLQESELFTEVVVAENLDDAERLFQEHKEQLAGVLMDACLQNDWPDTLELTLKMRESYDGAIVAMSSSAEYRHDQLKYGCDHETSKGFAALYLISHFKKRAACT